MVRTPAYYQADMLAFFDGRPWALPLYGALYAQLERLFPEAAVKVQKSQISFYGRHLFAAVSLPRARRKGWPAQCLVVTFGLGARVDHPRIAAAVEPYPRRWTHHVLLSRPEEVDSQLLGWLQEAYAFSQCK